MKNDSFLLPLVYYPDERLKKKSEPVINFDESVGTLSSKMLYTMLTHDGLGLAAPQVGVNKRIIVVRDIGKCVTLINPKILQTGLSEIEVQEGCLSIPGYTDKRKRSDYVVLEYQDEDGKNITNHFSGLTAFCIFHEIDHLNGLTFVDQLSQMKKQFIIKRIRKIRTSR